MFRKALQRGFAIPAMSLALVAGSALPALADEAADENVTSVQMIWNPENQTTGRVQVNLFGEDNVVVPGDFGVTRLAVDFISFDESVDPNLDTDCVAEWTRPENRPEECAAVVVSLVDVDIANPGADPEIYDHLTVLGFTAAEINSSWEAGNPVVVADDIITFGRTYTVPFDWDMPVLLDGRITPGNVAVAGAPLSVTFTVQITLTGELPTTTPPPGPPVITDPPVTYPPPPCPPHGPCPPPPCPPHGPCPSHTPWPPHHTYPPHIGHPPTGGGGIIAETGGFLVQQPMWIWGLAALAVAAVIGYARKRPAEQQNNG